MTVEELAAAANRLAKDHSIDDADELRGVLLWAWGLWAEGTGRLGYAPQWRSKVAERPSLRERIDRFLPAAKEVRRFLHDEDTFRLVSEGWDVEAIDRLADLETVLRDAQERATAARKLLGKSGQVPNPDWHQDVVSVLARYWKGLGRRFSAPFDADAKTEKATWPQSESGEFVVAVMQTLDPSVTEAACRTAMKPFLDERPYAKGPRKRRQ